MESVVTRALREAAILQEEGLDGILVENFKDAPFFPDAVPPETVAAVSVVVEAVVRSSNVPVGVNVLRNDARSAMAVAAATNASFIRVNVHTGVMFTDQGMIQGKAHDTLRQRAALGIDVAILADVLVKHATPPHGLTLEAAARDAWFRGLADGIILTGRETGSPVRVEEIRRLREALPPEGRIWVGSGATRDTVGTLREAADGIIAGSALQRGGRAGGGGERRRVRAFMSRLAS